MNRPGVASPRIARAGAITLAEITALGKPSILIPLPTSAGGHQRSNAEALAAAGAALLIDENEADAAGKIARSLEQFGGDCARLTQMSSAAYRLAKPNAAGDMVEAIRSLDLRSG